MKALERFLRYAAYPTMSDSASSTVPSTEKQLRLASALRDELLALGLADARVDAYGYVYASLPQNTEKSANTIGLIAHMDTSSAASDQNIRTRVVDYAGGDIVLNEEKSIVMRVADYPYLADYAGQHLVVSDDTTLIGADDKAGIAEIMTALEALIRSGAAHGKVCVAFTPDEKIGRGADHFDVASFGADYAYTVDGGALGEFECENFNAGGASVRIHGISIHPGSAKNKMKNAARIACEFDSMLPADEIPEKTEGYEGFHHLSSLEGGTEDASLSYIIRDHDRAKFEAKKKQFEAVAEALNARYGEGTVELSLHDSYYNMKEQIAKHPHVVERALRAMRDVGVTPRVVPIRGGTDGARLSFMGLPCPNFCTGGENFHSRFEFVSAEAMEKIAELLRRLLENAVSEGKA